MKVKLAKFKTSLLMLSTTMLIFLVSWIVFNIPDSSTPLVHSRMWGIVFLILALILMFNLLWVSIRMTYLSIKTMQSAFSSENKNKRIFTFCFGLAFFVLSILIVAFSLTWIAFYLKDGIINSNEVYGNFLWLQANFLVGKVFVAGVDGKQVFSNIPFKLLVTTFILIVIWCITNMIYQQYKNKTI